jgi:hypothetical protein
MQLNSQSEAESYKTFRTKTSVFFLENWISFVLSGEVVIVFLIVYFWQNSWVQQKFDLVRKRKHYVFKFGVHELKHKPMYQFVLPLLHRASLHLV